MKPLSVSQIESELSRILGWQFIEGRLVKEFRFTNFPTAVVFLNKLVDPIEELFHFPSIIIQYNRVRISSVTPEAGGVTAKDFQLARRIDELT